MFRIISIVLTVSLLLAGSASAENLYSIGGKKVSDKDLSPSMKNKFHEIADESFHKKSSLIDSAILDMHISELAKKQGKSRADVEAKLFNVKDATEKEINEWFKQNKHRMPPQYTFDQIKGDITRLLKGEKQKKKHAEIIAKIKKEKKVKILLQAPVAPKVDLNIAEYPVKGNKSAKVTIVEFADYQCPHCQEAGKVIRRVMKKFKNKTKLVFVDFPINRSGISKLVAQGAYCANQQGKYWEYHELAYSTQKTLKKESPAELAKKVGLDNKKFDACFKSKKPLALVEKAKAEGDRVGVGGTPTIYVNGRKIHGYDESALENAIKKAL
jgi:protein-disulfide isomerase